LKFLIDENISPDVVDIFKEQGLSAYHINDIKAHKKQRVVDDQIRRLALRNEYIIVTKDDDFVRSFVSRKVPEKLVFLYGLDSKALLLDRLEQIVHDLKTSIETHDFIEVTKSSIKFPFS